MTRTLFVGDLHAKPDLLEPVSRIADQCHADRLVLLGDLNDDWNLSNNAAIRAFRRLAAWWRMEHERRDTILLLGNHDIAYWMKPGSAAYARVRRASPGFKPGAHRAIHRMMHELPVTLAWSDGRVLATHAGVTLPWAATTIRGYETMGPREMADWLNRSLVDTGRLGRLYDATGPARGGTGLPGPLWADESELTRLADHRWPQIVGHTPVSTVTHRHGIWFTDTMSTMPDGTPIGDGSLLLMDDENGTPLFEAVPRA